VKLKRRGGENGLKGGGAAGGGRTFEKILNTVNGISLS
jgi:hypothetical protein